MFYALIFFFINDVAQPLWLLKTAKEQHLQRLVHLSADLARQLGIMLDNYHNGPLKEVISFDLLRIKFCA